MKLMVDNDLPFRLAHALQCIFPDHEIVALRDKFGRTNLRDEEWITALGAEGDWSVISADRRITRNPVQRNAFLGAGLVGFFFSASLKKAPLASQAARLLSLWPEICAQAQLNRNGCFEVPTSGRKFRIIGR